MVVERVLTRCARTGFVRFQGVGRRYANLVCKKADVDMNKRAGELNEEEVRFQMEHTIIFHFRAARILD